MKFSFRKSLTDELEQQVHQELQRLYPGYYWLHEVVSKLTYVSFLFLIAISSIMSSLWFMQSNAGQGWSDFLADQEIKVVFYPVCGKPRPSGRG